MEFEAKFIEQDGFTVPDWAAMDESLARLGHNAELVVAYEGIVAQWIRLLAEDLGGDYRVIETRQAFLVTDAPEEEAKALVDFIGRARDAIDGFLGDAADPLDRYRRLVFAFSEADDYYAYVSRHYSTDRVAATSGVCLSGVGYAHVAVQHVDSLWATQRCLAHELAHVSTLHLGLPGWLGEGVSLRSELIHVPLAGGETIMVEEDHHGFWTAENIQEFWAGTAFHGESDLQRLSYNLANVLFDLLRQQGEPLFSFLQQARWEDAGHTACHECFGFGLDDLAATFLGEGDWRPDRRRIKHLLGVP